MKQLVYGFVREQVASGLELAPGPEESPISMITAHGIAAASAPLTQCPSTSDLPSVLAFARVVSMLHSQCTTLPARFGSCVPSEAKLEEMMACRAASFRAGLDAIEGCEEMGLRAAWSTSAIAAEHAHGKFASHLASETAAVLSPRTGCAGTGSDYMARLRARHDQDAASAQARALAIETLRDAFAGLYVRFEAEGSEDRDQRTLSLHFLTPRLNRSRFVSAFRALHDRSSMKLLLTGPWPPYHFSAVLSTIDNSTFRH